MEQAIRRWQALIVPRCQGLVAARAGVQCHYSYLFGAIQVQLGRRHLLTAGAALAIGRSAQAALPVPHSRELAFRIMRHGSQIGSHTLQFRCDGDALEVNIAVDVKVSLGPIPLVHYSHRNQESWAADRLVGLDSRTDRNGKILRMSACATEAGLRVEGSGTTPYIAPRNALASTYWYKAVLHGPIIGTQDGMLVRPAISQPDAQPIHLASGAETPARRYVLTGDLDVELWYDVGDTWVGMRFSVDDGSVISYERI
jgi:hypothetical protein